MSIECAFIFAIRPYNPFVPRAVRSFVDYLRQAMKDGFTVGN